MTANVADLSIFDDFLSSEDIDLSLIGDDVFQLKIKISGEGYHASIPGDLARSIWSLQESLYRAAAEILHGEPNISKLTAEERIALQLDFEVSEGSLDLLADTRTFSEKIAEGFKTMDSNDKKWVLIAAIVVLGGGYFGSDILKSHNISDALVEQSKLHVEPINKAMDLATIAIAKSSPNSSEITIGQRKLSSEEIKEINKTKRKSATFATIETTGSVVGIRKISSSTYKIELQLKDMTKTITATFETNTIFGEEDFGSAKDLANYIVDNTEVIITLLSRETKSNIEYELLSIEKLDSISKN